MECYGRAFGWVNCGHVKGFKYEPVKDPRLSILATSTPDSMFGKLNREKAKEGAWNRWDMFIETELPDVVYEGLVYEPSAELIEFCKMVHKLQNATPLDHLIKFSKQGWETFKQLDGDLFQPIKKNDGLLGGRLAEQAIKKAGMLAVANDRHDIQPEDLERRFVTRLGLYKRSFAAVELTGALSDEKLSVQANKAIIKALRKGDVHVSQIPHKIFTRWDSAFDDREQQAILLNLQRSGFCKIVLTQRGHQKLESHIEQKKPQGFGPTFSLQYMEVPNGAECKSFFISTRAVVL